MSASSTFSFLLSDLFQGPSWFPNVREQFCQRPLPGYNPSRRYHSKRTLEASATMAIYPLLFRRPTAASFEGGNSAPLHYMRFQYSAPLYKVTVAYSMKGLKQLRTQVALLSSTNKTGNGECSRQAATHKGGSELYKVYTRLQRSALFPALRWRIRVSFCCLANVSAPMWRCSI